MEREEAPRLPMAEVIRRARFIGQVRGAEDPLPNGKRTLYIEPNSILLNRLPASAIRDTPYGKEVILEGSAPPRKQAPDSFDIRNPLAPKQVRPLGDTRNYLIAGWLVLADDKVLAAFPLQYVPAALLLPGSLPARKEIEYCIAGEILSQPTADLVKAIEDIRSRKATVKDAARLDSIYRTARAFVETPLTHEKQMQRAKIIAARIRSGMWRQQVEKLFPVHDGGLMGSSEGRYYLGAEVMADVPYDWKTTGEFHPANWVNGPVRLYRSLMHYD